jgi:hypothetical protein
MAGRLRSRQGLPKFLFLAVAWSGPTIGRPRGLLVCTLCLSLLVGMRSSERPGAVKGAPLGAAKRTLDGEDRSETIAEEGKQMWTPVDFLKRGQAKRLRCACVNHGSI